MMVNAMDTSQIHRVRSNSPGRWDRMETHHLSPPYLSAYGCLHPRAQIADYLNPLVFPTVQAEADARSKGASLRVDVNVPWINTEPFQSFNNVRQCKTAQSKRGTRLICDH